MTIIESRDCGPCVSCCSFFTIAELAKPAGVLCGHSTDHGCTIYADRPKACRVFYCAWRCWDAVPETWRPDQTGFILGGRLAAQNFLSVTADPARPEAWRAEPYYSMLRQWARDGALVGSSVAVFIGSRVIVLGAEGELDLGEVGVDEVLVRGPDGQIRKAPRDRPY
jgi:hypothetical protein